MEALAYLQKYGQLIDLYLAKFFKRKREEVSKIDPFLIKTLFDLEKYLYGGKKLRGGLTILGYQISGNKNLNKIIPVACAVEIMHSSLLIHDDYIDRDEFRRGKSTIHKLYSRNRSEHYGASMAIVMGDFGIYISNQIFAGAKFSPELIKKAVYEFNKLLVDTVYGETLDVEYDYRRNILWEDIVNIRILKTARYTFVLPLTVGAIMGGSNIKILKAIKSYGEPVGLAFQIKDDILGVFGDSKITGKSNDSDIREGKITFLYSKAIELASKKDKDFVKKWYGSSELTDDKINKIRFIMKKSGALEYSQNMALELVAKSKKPIPAITNNKELQNVLSDLADFVVARNK